MSDIRSEWDKVRSYMQKHVRKRPDLNAVLFLIGIREKGFAPQEFTKEQKQDLMNLALCRVLSLSGYFEETGKDEEGWPHWEQKKQFPAMGVYEQENFIKEHIIYYCREEQLIE